MSTPSFPLRVVRADEADVGRRTFLKLLGSAAIAASAACAKPAGEIVPYVKQPPELVPGVPSHFATAMELDGYASGLLVESREGRPVKVEGNPEHPASLGASSAFEQAAILQLYDPDRPQYVRHQGRPASWEDCRAAFSRDELRRVAGDAGAGLFFLLEPTGSPMVAELAARIHERFPAASFHYYAPLFSDAALEGSRLALGAGLQAIYDLRAADVIVAADADLIAQGPFHLRYARQFADARRVRAAGDPMNRLYAIEGAFTPTGVAADHRLAVRPGEIVRVLAAMLDEALAAAPGGAESAARAALGALADTPHRAWARAAAQDLAAHRGRSCVAVGPRQPAIAHALGAALNAAIGGAGATVGYAEPAAVSTPGVAPLVEAMRGGAVRALVVIGGNPSYNAPADAGFSALLRGVPLTLFAGAYESETARDAQWFVPLAHFLESWGDARALDGTASIVQPLIAPLHGARSLVEVLASFAGEGRSDYEIVRERWLDAARMHGDESVWREALRHGVVPGTAAPATAAAVEWPALSRALAAQRIESRAAVEVAFVSDPSVHDGRFANNAWLQELPDPITKLTWDNAAYMSQATLDASGAKESELVEIAANGRTLSAPAFVAPGLADALIVLPLGYGRAGGETIADGVGVNAYTLWTSSGFTAGASAKPALRLGFRQSHDFAATQLHWSLEGRPILLEADRDRFDADPTFTAEHRRDEPALYGWKGQASHQWAMAIDLSVCTGCSACVVACQAENNVPTVGKLGVLERREMHWLRIDRYLSAGSSPQPRINMQPMLCQQCEDAPCEYVCPVNATVHSPDGLNEMVYNRCVGTRFCSNNCPYKVRRFNYLNYTQELPDTEQMAMNPDVTVRARGVMEKCTFCVQRIRRADIDAQLQDSGEPYARLQTACQQACPTRAIVFGSVADPGGAVARDARAPQSYRVLNELGTRPRIAYLARLRNVNRAVPEETS